MSRRRQGRGIFVLSIISTLVGTLAVAMLLLFWMQMSSPDHVLERTRHFADIMQVVRPAVLLVILLSWRQIFEGLHSRSMVTGQTQDRALAIWPRLAVWIALFELTLGQGYVLLGLVVLVVYLAFSSRESG